MGGGVVVSLGTQFVSELGTGSPTTASYQLGSDGNVRGVTSSGSSVLETWLEPTTANKADYEARAQVVSGSTPNIGSALNTWLELSTTRSWGLSSNISGREINTELLVQIRAKASGDVVASASVYITVEKLF